MSAPDDHDPHLTRAMALWAEAAVPALPDDFAARVAAEAVAQRAMGEWAEAAVPALPDDFTARVMADVAAQRAMGAWAEAAVPALPEGFAAEVAAKAAARPKLQVVDGGGGAAREAAPTGRAWWRWPAVAMAAAAAIALLTARAAPTDDHPEPVAQREAGVTPTPTPVVDPVAGAIAEVTRVEVLGAQSVAVLTLGADNGGPGSPVVWITDKAEDAPGGAPETRMQ